jgi:hypothetical protein
MRAQYDQVSADAPPNLVYTKRYDYIGSSPEAMYEGWAAPGSATSDAIWAIRKHTYSGTHVVLSEWADGDSKFDNVWDDRTTLSYS